MNASARGFDLLTGRTRSIRPDQIIQVIKRASPVVLSVPHSGTWIPPEALAYIHLEKRLLLDTDIYTHELFSDVRAYASCVETKVNPYVVNVNRSGNKPDKPIIPTNFLYGRQTLRRAMPPQLQRQLIQRYYQPYHRALDRLIAAAKKEYGFALVIDGHSLGSLGGPFTKDPGEARADFVLGDHKGAATERAVVMALAGVLRKRRWQVAINKPYSGGFIVQRTGAPRQHIHAIQIEVQKKLYVSEVLTESQLARKDALRVRPAAQRRVSRGLADAVLAAFGQLE